ncbi:hypothetical protein ACIRFH_16025 [Streptomyces sp. NPDC093586]|uniref:hypothetical protein n=1 Tax=Streptomyces sp. NPDC093586 TaxID=3366042 RepID=UPI00382ED6CA
MTAVALPAAGGVWGAALSDTWAATVPGGAAEARETASGVSADEAARGKAFRQDDALRVYAGVLPEAEITELATVYEPPVDIG